jgi:hypothetical protein
MITLCKKTTTTHLIHVNRPLLREQVLQCWIPLDLGDGERDFEDFRKDEDANVVSESSAASCSSISKGNLLFESRVVYFWGVVDGILMEVNALKGEKMNVIVSISVIKTRKSIATRKEANLLHVTQNENEREMQTPKEFRTDKVNCQRQPTDPAPLQIQIFGQTIPMPFQMA